MFRVSYLINDNILKALDCHKHIKEHLELPHEGYSDLEIVRLLDNQHYYNIKVLTELINDILPIATVTADKVLKAKDPFEFKQSLAELFLFNHLAHKQGSNIKPKLREDEKKVWDFNAITDGLNARIEVFTPIELAGSQVFKSLILTLLKYIDLPLGFDLNIQIDTIKTGDDNNLQDLFYVYTIGNIDTVHNWFSSFSDSVKNWLDCFVGDKQNHGRLILSGPSDTLEIKLSINEISDDRQRRYIEIHWPTKSSDTKLFFSVGNVKDWAMNDWGRKIRKKNFDQQCGSPNPNSIRILVINFSIADTGWPNFISEEWFTSNFKNLIQFLVNHKNPYDVVIPAQLDISCCFGHPVSIKDEMTNITHEIISSIGMDTLCKSKKHDSQLNQIDELIN